MDTKVVVVQALYLVKYPAQTSCIALCRLANSSRHSAGSIVPSSTRSSNLLVGITFLLEAVNSYQWTQRNISGDLDREHVREVAKICTCTCTHQFRPHVPWKTKHAADLVTTVGIPFSLPMV